MIRCRKRVLGCLLASGILLLSACGEQKSSAQNDANHQKRVKVVRSLGSTLPRSISVSGTLAAEEEVTLSMKVPGRVQTVLVDLGSPVRRGQSLLRLEPADFDLRVRQSQAAYEQARVRLGLQPEGRCAEFIRKMNSRMLASTT